jgi:hypothetical protein
MENWDVKLLESGFSHFTKKIMDRKSFAKLLKISKARPVYIR